jgi:hypothetical protein
MIKALIMLILNICFLKMSFIPRRLRQGYFIPYNNSKFHAPRMALAKVNFGQNMSLNVLGI